MQRGDLGFIPSHKSAAPNRHFFGSPGHPSKKGINAVSQVSKMQSSYDMDSVSTKPEHASEEMISKRTEWLETQERRMTATINEQKSETNRLSESMLDIKADQSLKTQGLEEKYQFLHQETKKMYSEMQTVYGKVSVELIGFTYAETALEKYKQGENIKFEKVATDEEIVTLTYPMEKVDTADDTFQCFMKCKTIDKATGQISIYWALVYEENKHESTKFIQEFSLVPNF